MYFAQRDGFLCAQYDARLRSRKTRPIDEMDEKKHAIFRGRLVFVGFGSIGQGTLPLILRHVDMPRDRITILTADERGRAEAEQYGIKFVVNPIKRLTGAIHVYGGDFFSVPRSEWDPEHLVERPFDLEKTMALFEESNRLYPR